MNGFPAGNIFLTFFFLYTDDTTLLTRSNTINELLQLNNEVVEQTRAWRISNNLSLNENNKLVNILEKLDFNNPWHLSSCKIIYIR